MKCMIYDYETLGTHTPTLPVLSIALANFDTDRFIDNPYTFKEVVDSAQFHKFDVVEQVEKLGCKIEKDTMDWWLSQDKEVRESQVDPSPIDCTITGLYDIIANMCDDKTLIFTRGNTFDPMITEFMLKKLGKGLPYPHWNVRDCRSYIEGLSYGSGLRNGFTPPELEGQTLAKHDPRVDIALDVIRIQSLVHAIS